MFDQRVIAAYNIATQLVSMPQEGIEKALDYANQFAVDAEDRYRLTIHCTEYYQAETLTAQRKALEKITDTIHLIRDKAREDVFLREQEKLKKLRQQQEHTDAPDDLVFTCRNVSFRYSPQFALTDINLDLRLGEITGIVGENANGKTTLCRIVAGELAEDEGELAYPVFQQPGGMFDWNEIKRHIAYLPQEAEKESWYRSVRETMTIEAAINGYDPQWNDLTVDFLIHRLGLKGYENFTWKQLSGGYKLRFRLALTLIKKPRLLILDEPLANLDIKAQITLLSDLRDLVRSIRYPLSILITSQHIDEIEAVADQVIFLNKGKMEMAEPPGHALNCYELSCSAGEKELQEIFSDSIFSSVEIRFNGLNHLIVTDEHLHANEILKALLAHNVDIHFFRNISNSAKKHIFLG